MCASTRKYCSTLSNDHIRVPRERTSNSPKNRNQRILPENPTTVMCPEGRKNRNLTGSVALKVQSDRQVVHGSESIATRAYGFPLMGCTERHVQTAGTESCTIFERRREDFLARDGRETVVPIGIGDVAAKIAVIRAQAKAASVTASIGSVDACGACGTGRTGRARSRRVRAVFAIYTIFSICTVGASWSWRAARTCWPLFSGCTRWAWSSVGSICAVFSICTTCTCCPICSV